MDSRPWVGHAGVITGGGAWTAGEVGVGAVGRQAPEGRGQGGPRPSGAGPPAALALPFSRWLLPFMASFLTTGARGRPVRPRHRGHGLGRHDRRRVRGHHRRADGRDRAGPRRRRLPVDRLRAEQGAAGVGQGRPRHAHGRQVRPALGRARGRHRAGVEAHPGDPARGGVDRRRPEALRGHGDRHPAGDGPAHRARTPSTSTAAPSRPATCCSAPAAVRRCPRSRASTTPATSRARTSSSSSGRPRAW